MTHSTITRVIGALAAATALHAPAVLACAACYGKSDSPLAEGMNWGIFALLGCIAVVLSGFAGVGVYFARRSAAVAATPAAGAAPGSEPTPKA